MHAGRVECRIVERLVKRCSERSHGIKLDPIIAWHNRKQMRCNRVRHDGQLEHSAGLIAASVCRGDAQIEVRGSASQCRHIDKETKRIRAIRLQSHTIGRQGYFAGLDIVEG